MKLRADRKDERRKEALTRQAISDLLTPQERLKALDAMLGKGKGAHRERTKLLKRLDKDAEVAETARAEEIATSMSNAEKRRRTHLKGVKHA